MNEQNFLEIFDVFTDSSLDSNLSLRISHILNPYSLSSLGKFEVYIQSRFGGIVGQETNGQLFANQPSMPKLAKLESSVKTINQFTNITFQISPLNFFNENDTFEIIFPEVLSLESFSIVFSLLF